MAKHRVGPAVESSHLNDGDRGQSEAGFSAWKSTSATDWEFEMAERVSQFLTWVRYLHTLQRDRVLAS